MAAIEVMDVDASQYASISREMMDNGSYLVVKHRLEDYLDKPPFLFWISAISMKIFGINHFAYRLPSFLILLLGVYSTYRLAKLLYNESVGLLAALFIYCTQAVFLIAHDVRTDTILMGAVIFSTWQLAAFVRSKSNKWLLGATIGLAVAMMEKGPIGLMVPVLALGCDILYRKSMSTFADWRLYAIPVFVLVLLLPMVYGLYVQHGEEGVTFYFWTQSFGRITGENVWKDNTTFLYFFHNYLWAFIPWTVVSVFAIAKQTGVIVTTMFNPERGSEALTLGGFWLPFIALSFSHYKLPHYIFVVFPFAAIMSAHYLDKWVFMNKTRQKFLGLKITQIVSFILLWAVAVLLAVYVEPVRSVFFWIILGGLFVTFLYFLSFRSSWTLFVAVPVITACGINLVMNTHFYPWLTGTYQSGSVAAEYIEDNNIPLDNLYYLDNNSHAMDFYTKTIIPHVDKQEFSRYPGLQRGKYLFINNVGENWLNQQGIRYQLVKKFPHQHPTMVTGRFLNPNTREKALEYRKLVRVI